MSSSPDFTEVTVRTLAFRSGLICNAPSCQMLTAGPSESDPTLKIKIGEAAHIRDARKQTHRFDSAMNDDERSDIANGIWLCASCHEIIDKSDGLDYSVALLHSWKENHEEIISTLLHSHRSPFPMLREFTDDGRLAQNAVEAMSDHGALFVDTWHEDYNHVVLSIERLRSELGDISKKIKIDKVLKKRINDMRDYCRDYMNITSKNRTSFPTELAALRSRAGIFLKSLRDEYKSKIKGRISDIVPQ